MPGAAPRGCGQAPALHVPFIGLTWELLECRALLTCSRTLLGAASTTLQGTDESSLVGTLSLACCRGLSGLPNNHEGSPSSVRSQSKPTPQHRATNNKNYEPVSWLPGSQLTTSPKSLPVATLLALRATTELASSSRGTNKTAEWLHQ